MDAHSALSDHYASYWYVVERMEGMQTSLLPSWRVLHRRRCFIPPVLIVNKDDGAASTPGRPKMPATQRLLELVKKKLQPYYPKVDVKDFDTRFAFLPRVHSYFIFSSTIIIPPMPSRLLSCS